MLSSEFMRRDRLKAVIFDMDGVIIDSEPLHIKIERELLEEFGGKITDEEHDEFIGTTDYHMWSTLKDRFNLEPSVDEMIKIKKRRFVKNIDKVELVEGFYDLMLELYNENYLLALASSNNRKTVDLILDMFDLDKYIKYSISGEEVEKGKPNPEIFLKVAKKLDVSPQDCLVIEDAFAGVAAAKAAGMKCIGFKNPNSGNQDLSKADIVIEDFKQINLEDIRELF